MNVAHHPQIDTLEWWDVELRSGDPLVFPGYSAALRAASGEAVRTGLVRICGERVALIESRFENFGGTMGAAAGERVVRAFRRATKLRVPVLAITATGGARLQEGMIALVQMGRTTAARSAHAAAGLLTVAVHRSPTTGGVYASWASLADVRAANPGAVVGFAGPRVVEHVTGQLPPFTSHTAESAYAAGLVDAVVGADEEARWVEAALGVRDLPLRIGATRPTIAAAAETADGLSGWQAVRAARDPRRPSGLEWAAALCSSWVDLHGTDPVIRAGLATLGGQRVVVVAMDRHAKADGAARPTPAAYRLAQRAIALAGQLGMPILTLVDTPGAEPGPRAEWDGIAGEIARTLRAMVEAPTPTVCLCVGEGGSGGALALGYADRLLMLRGAIFSVIGPEAASAILLRDPTRAPEMADALRLTGPDLLRLGVVDGLLPGAGVDAVDIVRKSILDAFDAAVPGDRERRNDHATHAWLKAFD